MIFNSLNMTDLMNIYFFYYFKYEWCQFLENKFKNSAKNDMKTDKN